MASEGKGTSVSDVPQYGYRWVIMVGAALVLALIQFGVFISAGCANSLMGPEYGLSTMQFSMISTMPYLMGFVGGLFAGAWADRTSIRTVMLFGLAVGTVGSLLRVLNTTFPCLLVSALLLGFALAALNANSAKLLRVWFPKRGLGVAMGVYTTGASVGAAVALKLGTLVSVQTAYLVAFACVLVGLLIWVFLMKTSDYEKNASEPIFEYLGIVCRNRYVWFAALFMFFLFGCSVTEQTFINSAFTELTGSAATASTIAMVNSICVAIGGIVMPMVIGRFKRMKPVMVVAAVLMCINMIGVLVMPYGWFTWVRMVLQGVYMGTLLPLGKTLPALIPGVKEEHLGAAGGIQSMFQNLGGWLICSYIIAPIITATVGDTFLAYYVGAGISVLLAGLCILLLPETGTTVEQKRAREAAVAVQGR